MRKANFTKNKLKHNATLIETNVRGSVTTGLKMMNNIKKMSINKYYRTARKYFPNKSNRRFTRRKKRRGGSGKVIKINSDDDNNDDEHGSWDDDGFVPSSSKSKFKGPYKDPYKFIKGTIKGIFKSIYKSETGDVHDLEGEFEEFEKTSEYKELIRTNNMYNPNIDNYIYGFIRKNIRGHSPMKRRR